MHPSVIAVITEEIQNDVIAALHTAGVGHLTRVIRRERGDIPGQLTRAGVDTDNLPPTLPTADRIVMVTPAPLALETACLVLQRGAISAWTLTPDDGWQAIDDKAIEIAATRELPARPVAPAHRSARTFRKPNIRRRPRRGVSAPSAAGEAASS
jgi:hypothetical protein